MSIGERAKESTDVTGTGTANLGGTVAGFQTFVASLIAHVGGAGPWLDVPYVIVQSDANGNNTAWEMGRGTVTDGTPDTLTRGSVTFSSNSDALVSFGVGTKTIQISPHARDFPLMGQMAITGATILTPGNFLANGTAYTCTLPLLSTHPEGPAGDIDFIVGAAGLKKINRHASDSAGSEIFQGYDIGDRVKIRKINSQWVRLEHKAELEVVLTRTSPLSAVTNIWTLAFDSGYTETADPAGLWDSVTNNIYTAPFDCIVKIVFDPVLAGNKEFSFQVWNNTSDREVTTPITVVSGGISLFFRVDASDELDVYCQNHQATVNYNTGSAVIFQIIERLD